MPEAKRVCVLICGSAEGAEPKAKTDKSLQRKTDLFFFHPVQTFRQYNAETYHFFPPLKKASDYQDTFWMFKLTGNFMRYTYLTVC